MSTIFVAAIVSCIIQGNSSPPIAEVNRVSFGSDNGLLPFRRQVII